MTRRSSKRRSSKRRSSKRPAPVRPNYTAPKRDFEFEGGGEEDDLKSQIRREMVEKLAAEWNELNSKLEERSFRSREDREEDDMARYENAEEQAWQAMPEWAEANDVTLDFDDYKRKSWPPEAREHFEKLIVEFSKSENDSENLGLRMQVVEELIGELGGRMMRPYEHWNEEESQMEYAERDRGDYEGDY